jgi:hypothetical protein
MAATISTTLNFQQQRCDSCASSNHGNNERKAQSGDVYKQDLCDNEVQPAASNTGLNSDCVQLPINTRPTSSE